MTSIAALGSPLKEYKRSGKSFARVLIVSLVFLLIAGLIFFGAFGGEKGLGDRIVLSVLGLVFSLPPAAGIYMLITRRGSSATLYQNGLVYRMGGKEFSTTWDDIASLTESTACRIERKNGESFDLGHNIEGYDEIAQALRDETLNRLGPDALARIDGGSSVSFVGLKAGGKLPLGQALPDALVGGGTFTVDAKGIALAEDGTKPCVPTSGETAPSGYLCTEGRRMDPRTCPSHPQFLVLKSRTERAPATTPSPA